ncbi:hypothetical protein GCM10017744_021170 [Streptomyces antimycoticus]
MHAWSARTGRGATILRPSLLVSDRPVHGSGQRQPLAVLAFLIHEALRRRAEDDPALASLLDGGDAHGSGLRVRVRAGSGGALNSRPGGSTRPMRRVRAPCGGGPSGARRGVRTVHLTHPHNTPFATAVKVLERCTRGFALDLVDDLDDPDPYGRSVRAPPGLAAGLHRAAQDVRTEQTAPGHRRPARPQAPGRHLTSPTRPERQWHPPRAA